MKKILFVDNERTVLRRLKNIFDEEDFQFIYENRLSHALDLVKENQIDLIAIDIHSSKHESIALLENLAEEFPDLLRVGMISFDNQTLFRKLLEENLVQHIIFKPWNDDEVHGEIKKMMKTRSSIYEKSFIDFIAQLEALPTLPKIYYALKAMIKDQASISQVADLIQNDLALTAFVLKVANTAYYGRKTGDVVTAIMKIGLSNLKDIVLSYSVYNFITSDKKSLNQIRQRAIISNRLMTEIYENCLHESVPTYFASAGLLHDIGKLLLLSYNNKKADTLQNSIDHSHQNLGGYLLNFWGLPFAYVEAAMFHHRPFDSRVINKKLVYVLAIVNHHLDGLEDDKMIEDLYERLNLKAEAVEVCVSEILEV